MLQVRCDLLHNQEWLRVLQALCSLVREHHQMATPAKFACGLAMVMVQLVVV